MNLTTNRLLLRPWALSDGQNLFTYAQDPLVGPICGWAPHQSVAESIAILEQIFINPTTWAICLKDEPNHALGSISLMLNTPLIRTEFMTAQEAEIGFWLGVPHWGQGYVPEAVAALVDYAFNDLALTALWCGYYAGNQQSAHVQKKAGFTFERTCENVAVPLLNETRTLHYTKLTLEQWQIQTSANLRKK